LSSSKAKPNVPSFDKWLVPSPATVETLRALLNSPEGNHVSDLERRVGDAGVVVRTLHHLQNAGIVKIQIEQTGNDLVVRVDGERKTALEAMLRRIS
jgi:hypothetical protein